MKPRIDTQAAIEWARQVLERLDRGELTADAADAAQLEYLIAHGITVDGIYQDAPAPRRRRWFGRGAK